MWDCQQLLESLGVERDAGVALRVLGADSFTQLGVLHMQKLFVQAAAGRRVTG